jgi:phosphohistidine swiveling domain-containing protein
LHNYPLLKRLISRHLRQFALTTTAFYLGKPMEEKDVLERIKIGLENYSAKKLKTNDREKKLFAKLDSYPEIKERLHIACVLMYWKNQRLDVQFKSDYFIHPLLETMAELMGLAFEQLVHLTYDEILNWFQSGELPTRKEIAKRIRSYSMHLKHGKVILQTDKAKYPILPSELQSSYTENDILSGIVAQRGKATGKVRLVMVSEDIVHVQKGEILVTLMTRPDMIVGMEKASAFITELGGMLSHAAIIAREMQKPCIVGTRHATKMLKTGMFVEVDAIKGKVTILS